MKFFGDLDDDNNKNYGSFGANIRRGDKKLKEKFAEYFNIADIIAVQEVENLDAFNNIIEYLNKEYPERKYQGFLRDNNRSPQDIGLIWDTNKVKGARGYFFRGKWLVINEKEEGDEMKKERFTRAPVYNFFEKNGIKFIVVSAHLKSKAGEEGEGGRRENESAKLAEWLEFQRAEKEMENIIILGDFNDRYSFKPENTELDALIELDRQNKIIFLTKDFRPPKYYTTASEFDGQKLKEVIDHIIITEPMKKYYVKDSCHIRILADTLLSDHNPVYATFDFSK